MEGPQLTPNACKELWNGNTSFNPIMQVIEAKSLQAASGGGTERFRVSLSDGEHFIHAMLATQLVTLVKDESIQPGTVIKVADFLCNVVHGRKITIILDLNVLSNWPIQGQPTNIANIGKNTGSSAPAPAPAQAPAQAPAGQQQRGLGYAAMAQATTNSNSNPNQASYGQKPQGNNHYQNQNQNHMNMQQGGGMNRGGGHYAAASNNNNPGVGGGYAGTGAGTGYGGMSGNYHQQQQQQNWSNNNNNNTAAGSTGSYHNQRSGGYQGGPASYSNNSNQGYGGSGGYGGGGGMGAGNGNHYQQQNKPSMYNQQVPNNYMPKGAISRNEAPVRIVPIKSLNPYLNRWTIQARITSKGEIRRWQNAKGEGTVFNFDVLDAEGGEIRICAFKDACEKFYPIIEVGKVYMISKGSLRPARKQYNPLNSEFEIYLETNSTIEPCMEDERTSSIPSINFNFQPILSLEQTATGSIVDVIGVILTVGSLTTIQRRDGTETQKRSVSIKDDSNAVIELTLWGSYCMDPGQQLEQDNQQGAHPVVAIKSARVGEYNGKTLGSISSTQIRVNPDIPEAGRLRHWWDKLGGAHQEAVQLNTQGGGGSDRRVVLADIRDEGLGTHGKPDYVEVLACISFIRNETLFYPACGLQRGGRTCQKKLTLTSDDGWCEPCQSKSEVQWRWMVQVQVSDASGQRWLAAFGEVADAIMGMKAEELKELENTPAFDAALARATFTRWLLKVKVAEDQWQDEKRIKVNIVKAMKPDFAAESRAKIESINQLLNEANASNKRMKHF